MSLHVPMERPLIEANPQVEVFGAYYREHVMLARDRDRGPVPESLAALKGKPVAVSGPSLAGWLLAGAEGGMLRESLSTQHADGVAAARALAARRLGCRLRGQARVHRPGAGHSAEPH